jgi:peptide chain release factor 3
VVQRFELAEPGQRGQLLGAVGPLQFEVVQYRLESEYGASSRITRAPWTAARWLEAGTAEADVHLPSQSRLAVDDRGRRVVLLADEWDLRYFRERNPTVRTEEVRFALGTGNGADRQTCAGS